MRKKRWAGLVLVSTAAISFADASPRYPADLALSPEGRWLLAANEGAGSVSLIDLTCREAVDELELDAAGRPAAIACAGVGGAPLVAVAERFRHRVALLRIDTRPPAAPETSPDGGDARPDGERSPPRLRLLRRVPVGRLPGDLSFSPDGRRLWVACEGDGNVWELETPSGRLARRLEAVEGARRLVAWTGEGRGEEALPRLVVAGRSEVAELDLVSGRRLAVHAPAGGAAFNIDGLAVRGGSVLLAHQVKPTEVAIEPPMIVWGLVIANRVTSFPLAPPLLDAEARPRAGSPPGAAASAITGDGEERPREARTAENEAWLIPLDLRHRAAGDPTAIAAVTSAGDPSGETLVVLSGGTDRALFADLRELRPDNSEALTAHEPLPDLAVGDRPVALAVTEDGERAFIACYLDDAVVEVDIEERAVIDTIPVGIPCRSDERRPRTPPREAFTSLARRGAAIYYDADRSRGGWYSCQSCHPGGGTRGHRFDTSADETGLAKKAPRLRGTGATGPWSWLGRFDSLEAQIASSLHRTMAVDEAPSREDVESVAAFLRSLPFPDPSPPSDPAAGVHRGRELFRTTGCADCHEPPGYTIPGRKDVGVADDFDGSTRFNPPSLRGVRDDSRYLHDGRAKSLRAVLREHDPDGRHGRAHDLDEAELRDLLGFLESL